MSNHSTVAFRHSSCVYFGWCDPPMNTHATACNGASHPWTKVGSHKLGGQPSKQLGQMSVEYRKLLKWKKFNKLSVVVIDNFVVIVTLALEGLLFSCCCQGLCFLSIDLLNHERVGQTEVRISDQVFIHLSSSSTFTFSFYSYIFVMQGSGEKLWIGNWGWGII